MNTRTRTWWAGCLALGMSACSSGISIGHDDGKLNQGETGGAASNDDGGTTIVGTGGAGGAAPGVGGNVSAGGGSNNVPPMATDTPACLPEDGTWTPLFQLSGPLPKLGVGRVCVRKIATSDMDISGLRLANSYPAQVALLVGAPTGPDGPCTGQDADPRNTLRFFAFASSGVGQVDFAEGSTLHLGKGEELTFVTEANQSTQNGLRGAAAIDWKLAAAPGSGPAYGPDHYPTPLGWNGGWDPTGYNTPQMIANSAPCDTPWQPLLAATTEIAPAEEMILCTRKTLTEDLDMGAIRAISNTPSGIEVRDIIVASVQPGDPERAPDGAAPCQDDSIATGFLTAGSGNAEAHFADGAGARFQAGVQVVLKMRILNRSNQVQQSSFLSVQYQASSP